MATDPTSVVYTDLGQDEEFGFDLDMDNVSDKLIVGAPYHGSSQGAAYVFAHTGNGSYVQEQLITHSASPGMFDYLGWSVAISGDIRSS